MPLVGFSQCAVIDERDERIEQLPPKGIKTEFDALINKGSSVLVLQLDFKQDRDDSLGFESDDAVILSAHDPPIIADRATVYPLGNVNTAPEQFALFVKPLEIHVFRMPASVGLAIQLIQEANDFAARLVFDKYFRFDS